MLCLRGGHTHTPSFVARAPGSLTVFMAGLTYMRQGRTGSLLMMLTTLKIIFFRCILHNLKIISFWGNVLLEIPYMTVERSSWLCLVFMGQQQINSSTDSTYLKLIALVGCSSRLSSEKVIISNIKVVNLFNIILKQICLIIRDDNLREMFGNKANRILRYDNSLCCKFLNTFSYV